jgi:glucose/arabinose dehydrogenase
VTHHSGRRALRSGHAMAVTLVVTVLALGACNSAGGDTGTRSPASTPTARASAGSDSPSATPSTRPSVRSGTAAIGLLSPVRLTVAAGTEAGPAAGRSLNLPAGWSAEIWADVPGARLAAWAPDGRLVVSTGDNGIVSILTPAGNGRAPEVATLLDGLNNPQGVAFAEREGRPVLVVGEETRLVSYDYADGAVSNRRVILDGLPGGGHGGKAVAVRDGVISYSVGSATNRDPVDRTSSPQRGVVAQVRLDGTGNRTIGTGIRNGFGLGYAPDGSLFAAVNQADNQPYPFRDDTGRYGQTVQEFVNDNPVEQLSRITPGTDLGWPYCVPDSRAGVTDLPFVNDPVNNPDGQALDCGDIGTTMVGLPSHSAPLGLAFTSGAGLPAAIGSGALISAHGSWNRQPPRPPYVAYSPWDDVTKTLGAAVELITGFQESDGSRWGRSVAAVPGPDRSIYLTDDQAGLVYRITPGGDAE